MVEANKIRTQEQGCLPEMLRITKQAGTMILLFAFLRQYPEQGTTLLLPVVVCFCFTS